MQIRDIKKKELKERIMEKCSSLPDDSLNGIADTFYGDNFEAYEVLIEVTSDKEEVYKFLYNKESSLDTNVYPHFNLIESKTWNTENPFDEKGFLDRKFVLKDEPYAIFTTVEQVEQRENSYYRFILIFDPNSKKLERRDFISQSIHDLLSSELQESEKKQDIIKLFTELSMSCDDKEVEELIYDWYFLFQ